MEAPGATTCFSCEYDGEMGKENWQAMTNKAGFRVTAARPSHTRVGRVRPLSQTTAVGNKTLVGKRAGSKPACLDHSSLPFLLFLPSNDALLPQSIVSLWSAVRGLPLPATCACYSPLLLLLFVAPVGLQPE
ncbi:hypothetical protein Ddc_08153 [Ditylenchus destructor]|nr:hypothetical protein Ddc_08153 [Ditylenchus destructor]